MTVPADAPLVLLLSGPNLNLLGTRQPEVYGTTTLAEHAENARLAAADRGLQLHHAQHNGEREMIEAVHEARGWAAGIIVNPGAFTHYSWGLHDALAAFDGPIVELHLSNPAAREEFRHLSVVAPVATGTVAGFGGVGYRLAVDAIAALIGVDGGGRA